MLQISCYLHHGFRCTIMACGTWTEGTHPLQSVRDRWEIVFLKKGALVVASYHSQLSPLPNV